MKEAAESRAVAVWAVTPGGVEVARRIQGGLGRGVCFAPRRLAACGCTPFDRPGTALTEVFDRFQGHVFVMATGIVVRLIAPLLRHKSRDPAVVVVDETGRWAISLVAGHLGGANRLARQTARILGAQAVITTATDLRGVPAVDAIAAERGLAVENTDAIKAVSMALLAGSGVWLFDPDGWFADALPDPFCRPLAAPMDSSANLEALGPGVWVDDRRLDLPGSTLVLRPPSLVAGVGCNRGTGADEILDLIHGVLARHGLSAQSLAVVASIDLKADETGLREAAAALGAAFVCFQRSELARVEGISSPSPMVQKHVGVGSVCEAAAILGARGGALIVPKHKSANATVAIARRACTSWASAPEPPITCPHGPSPF